MKRPGHFRRWMIVGTVLVTAAAAIGFWRDHAQAKVRRAHIPARPLLAGTLAERAAGAERRAARGSAALAELGQLYHANGFLPEAAHCYRGLAQLEPRTAKWPHRLAAIYAGAGRLEDAAALWERTLRLAPDYAPALIRLGDVRLKLNRAAEAATAYNTVLAHEKDNAFALAGLARLDLAAGRAVAAREKLERAAAASGGRIGADLLATVCEQAGDHARATALRARAKASGAYHDPADPWIDEIMDDCLDAYRLTVAAGFADHAGDTARALHLIERALRLAPDNAPAHFQAGLLAQKKRDAGAARAAFEACVRAAPDFSDGWLRLVELHAAARDEAAAMRALAAGLAHNPASGGLLAEQARRVAATGRHAEAADLFERSLRARPDDADTAVKLAGAYFRLERVADGVTALNHALAAEPDHPGALTTLALHAIGGGDEAAARSWLDRVRSQPRVPAAMADELAREFRRRFGREP
ncbi:MAG: tetratricopeptide repeat protein [Opitutaceae bacterium]|nr:tetratricopeptide repeat protein [Opitutaceae bacterium]